MFRRLRLQFIVVATIAVSIMLISIIGILNASKYATSEKRINKILDLLSKNNGVLPDEEVVEKILGRKTNPDIIVQYRYFSAYVDSTNKVITMNTEHIANLSETDVIFYIRKILSGKNRYGNFTTTDGQKFAYKLSLHEDESKLIVVLDTTSYIEDRADLIDTSVFIFFSNLVFFIIIFVIFSGKVMMPFMENYRNQKAFITNAGHELKTPLAIISANNELCEIIGGENEWTKSTKEQVERMTDLINRLVVLARFEEKSEDKSDVAEKNINFSDIVTKSANSFKSMAIKGGKNFESNIQKNLCISGDDGAIYELVNILIDNANKYCDDCGTVGVGLLQHGITFKKAKLVVYNTYKSGKGVDYSRFFERFYREDKSHNSNVSGYGVGLSIAGNIVKRHKGKIHISYKNDTIYFNVYFNMV
ncbi:histidine kinase A domain / GHKL domain multi-domain protein [Lachnoanaerobaculum saburreum F0468]|uniref:histidine kinase n=1 Tax=Lachnoanaerobaculum saburreum F0468 TaxID=1095750 RepID=I0R597_9FIRM|nr:HAMP domain-containing sensor histidine kinase [Lachnoanaerobaculum saburreum]EIC94855.1 histidine kinase A domain / GHKL domain multi-domain protein [Lachnoanaerobaculum saburreum F0468]